MTKKKHLGVMADCSRNAVLRVSGVKRLIDALEKMGYNMLMLYTEDTYEVEHQPLFGYLRGRYTKEELKELVAYGEAHGVELIPCVQTLAHLNQIFRWKEYRAINDCDDILLMEDERTYALIEDMFRSLRECYSTDVIHIGMDEAHNLGTGKYKELHGEQNRFEILKRHLERVVALAEKYHFKPIMWSDMFFRLAAKGEYYIDDPAIITPEITATVPEQVELVYWDYYHDEKEKYDCMIDAHKRFGKPVWFAGGAWTWTGFAPHNRGSIKRTREAMQSCREKQVENVFLTCWGDGGGEATVFSVLPTLYYAAEVARGNNDEEKIKAGFAALFGIDFDAFLGLDLPAAPTEAIGAQFTSIECGLLYQDPFLGWLDPQIAATLPDAEATYQNHAAALEPFVTHPEFGYLFEAMAALCRALAVKTGLGIKTRKAYDSGDKAALAAVVERYKLAQERVEAFYEAYRKAWLHDKKGSGFEVQDIRLGGLIGRLRSCRRRLEDYLNGKIDTIDELDQPLAEAPDAGWPRWENSATVNIMNIH